MQATGDLSRFVEAKVFPIPRMSPPAAREARFRAGSLKLSHASVSPRA
jgi:hypothetical protein